MTRIRIAAQAGLSAAGVVLCSLWLYRMEVIRSVSAEFPLRSESVSAAPVAGSVLARIEIPAVNVATSVLEGVDEDELGRAAGHVPHTALPGGLGNFAVAGHRDTVFRNLGGVKAGMDILVTSSLGRYRYRVQSAQVVSPGDVQILDSSMVPTLTLITCYPFHYIGAAPLRFSIKAILLTVS